MSGCAPLCRRRSQHDLPFQWSDQVVEAPDSHVSTGRIDQGAKDSRKVDKRLRLRAPISTRVVSEVTI